MERTIKDVFLSLLPLSNKHRIDFAQLKEYLDRDQLKDLKYLVKTKKVAIARSEVGVDKDLAEVDALIRFNALHQDKNITTFVKDLNDIVKTKTFEASYRTFAKHAREKLTGYIAPNILGHEAIKEAALLQLFSTERFHLLLIGDPGTGKTDILRSMVTLSPISSFGLGSGTSGAGLAASKKGKELNKGLLAQAHQGICCIDELNLMKRTDMAALYSAMEKGFITYDKGGTHKKIEAETRVQATANPTGDRFVGKSLSILKKQLPFDSALLTRFHLVFVIRKPGKEQLVHIAKKIVQGTSLKLRQEDVDYIKSYVDYAHKIKVDFDKRFESLVAAFIRLAKDNEHKYMVEIGPRTVHAIIRLAQAYARVELRSKVINEDVKRAIALFEESLLIEDIIRP